MDVSHRASWDWKEVCGKSTPQLEQGSKRASRSVHLRKDRLTAAVGAACILGIGESGGQGSLEKGRGLVLGKTKSDADAAVSRVADVAVRRTHPSRSVAPRTTAKCCNFSRNRTLLFAAIVALLVLRTRPLPHVAQHVVKPKGVGGETPHRSRLLVPAAAAAVAVGVVAANSFTPVTGCPSSGPCRVFPLRCHCRRQ